MNTDLVDTYLRAFDQAIHDVPRQQIVATCDLLLDAFDRNAWVFLVGNGGSAALASHFACDLEKTTAGTTPRSVQDRFRVCSLVDNVASLTAWGNDEGYEHIFSEGLRSRARAGDVLVAITASGNSPNIVAALERAGKMGLRTVGLLGFDGGRAKPLCEHAVHVASMDYGIVEGAHSVLTHLITRALAEDLEGRRADHERRAS
ncbi:MAG: SIS domain-containing protein [Nannocystaceae bacterium]